MAVKLYPPYIDGTIPAFYRTYDAFNDLIQGATIVVPFSMNGSVGQGEIAGIVMRIRTVSTSKYLFDPIPAISFDFDAGTATFILDQTQAETLTEGQYYKIQLAYIAADGNNTVGYYSTVGVIKCVSRPSVYIEGMNIDSINAFSNGFLGVYDLNDCIDLSEKEYSYKFDFYNENDELLFSSDELVHNTATDVDYNHSIDRYVVNDVFEDDKTYGVKYTVTTMNGLVISSAIYKMTTTSIISAPEGLEFYAYGNYDDGYIKLTFRGEDEYYSTVEIDEEGKTYINPEGGIREALYYGQFLICRSSEQDGFGNWIELYRFRLDNQCPSEVEFHDFTVQQGIKYRYSLQQYNIKDLYSDRKYALDKDGNDTISIDFEDIFLYDGHRQLKVRFNAKVSSFKTDILESKTDTIGNKYPFIFRNGKVAYKEFPVGGLISFIGDENSLFYNFNDNTNHIRTFSQVSKITQNRVNKNDYYKIEYDANSNPIVIFDADAYQNAKEVAEANQKRKEEAYAAQLNQRDKEIYKNYFDTDLVERNVLKERLFKLSVLDWLNDGKPKLFRSPTEGNYIVRLLNNSLTPEDQVGRIIHNFSSTAYEIAEFNYDNLVKFGFVSLEEPEDYVPLWKTVNFEDDEQNALDNLIDADGNILITFPSDVMSFSIDGMFPGSLIEIKFSDKPVWDTVCIGTTGSYTVENIDRGIDAVKILNQRYAEDGSLIYVRPIGTANYHYKGLRLNAFDAITDVKLKTIVAKQFVGVDPNLVNAKKKILTSAETGGTNLPAFSLSLEEYRALAGLKFRDYFDYVKIQQESGANDKLFYKANNYDKFEELISTLIPGDTINQINSTIYNEGNDKVRLINMEHAHLRVRELFPIYNTYRDPNGHPENDLFAMTPFGKPYPIDELYQGFNEFYHYVDPYCVFEAFEEDKINKKWIHYGTQEDTRNKCYYDAHWGAWMDTYDTSFYIDDPYIYARVEPSDIIVQDNEYYYYSNENLIKFDMSNMYVKQYGKYLPANECLIYTNEFYPDFDLLAKTDGVDYFINDNNEFIYSFYVKENNQIDLLVIKEMDLYNLGKINSLVIGSGVMAEETFQLKVIDYYTEDTNSAVAQAKQNYLSSSQLLTSLLLKLENIEIADKTYQRNLVLYKAYSALLDGTKNNSDCILNNVNYSNNNKVDILQKILDEDIDTLQLMPMPEIRDPETNESIPIELSELKEFMRYSELVLTIKEIESLQDSIESGAAAYKKDNNIEGSITFENALSIFTPEVKQEILEKIYYITNITWFNNTEEALAKLQEVKLNTIEEKERHNIEGLLNKIAALNVVQDTIAQEKLALQEQIAKIQDEQKVLANDVAAAITNYNRTVANRQSLIVLTRMLTEIYNQEYPKHLPNASDYVSEDEYNTAVAKAPQAAKQATLTIIGNYFSDALTHIDSKLESYKKQNVQYAQQYSSKYTETEKIINSISTYNLITGDRADDNDLDSYIIQQTYSKIELALIYIAQLEELAIKINQVNASIVQISDDSTLTTNIATTLPIDKLLNQLTYNEYYKYIYVENPNLFNKYINTAYSYIEQINSVDAFMGLSLSTKKNFSIVAYKILYLSKYEDQYNKNAVNSQLEKIDIYRNALNKKSNFVNTPDEYDEIIENLKDNNLYIPDIINSTSEEVSGAEDYIEYFTDATINPEINPPAAGEEREEARRFREQLIECLINNVKNEVSSAFRQDLDVDLAELITRENGILQRTCSPFTMLYPLYGADQLLHKLILYNNFIYDLNLEGALNNLTAVDDQVDSYQTLVNNYKTTHRITSELIGQLPLLEMAYSVPDDKKFQIILSSDVNKQIYLISNNDPTMECTFNNYDNLPWYGQPDTSTNTYFIENPFTYSKTTSEDGIEVEDGIVYWYIRDTLIRQINKINVLETQSNNLSEEYLERSGNYDSKRGAYYDKYTTAFENYQTYEQNYREEFEFYHNSADGRAQKLIDYENKVRDNWNQFVITLDVAFTEEKARGQYK